MHESMLLGDPPRPAAGEKVFQRFGFAGSGERVTHDGFDQLQRSRRDAAVGFDPVAKVFSKIRI
jgi:hypothetical protein